MAFDFQEFATYLKGDNYPWNNRVFWRRAVQGSMYPLLILAVNALQHAGYGNDKGLNLYTADLQIDVWAKEDAEELALQVVDVMLQHPRVLHLIEGNEMTQLGDELEHWVLRFRVLS